MGVELITFDAGNTLIHAYPSVSRIYSEVSAELGAPVAPETFENIFLPAYRKHTSRLHASPGRRGDEEERVLWRSITRDLFDSIPVLRHGVDFETWFERLYDRFGAAETWRTYGDAEETLCELKYAGYRLGLISNWDTRLRRIAKGLQILQYMHAVAISSEVGYRKPDPRIFEVVRRYVAVEPGAALHVGDLVEEDVEGARKAGWRAVLLDREGRTDPPEGVPRIRSLREIWNHVR